MEQKIDYRFKLIYAIGMIMVVAGHMRGGVDLTLGGWFPYLGLHLAFFAFSSGYFFKDHATDAPGQYVLKKAKSLLIPLYIYNFVYGLIVYISRFKGFSIGLEPTLYNLLVAPITDGHQFDYNLGGWFVIPLFMVEVFYVFLRKLFSLFKRAVPEWVIFAICTCLGLFGNELARRGFNTGWLLVLVRMLYFVPFYALGAFYKRGLEDHTKNIPGIVFFPVVFGARLLINLCYGKVLVYAPSWCEFKENAFMPLIIGILGIAVWVRIATIFEPVLGRNKCVNLVADNTYSIMINQFAGFMLIKTIYAGLHRLTPFMADFNMDSFKSDIWYCYLPGGIPQTGIFYTIAGIGIPILIQMGISRIKSTVKRS